MSKKKSPTCRWGFLKNPIGKRLCKKRRAVPVKRTARKK